MKGYKNANEEEQNKKKRIIIYILIIILLLLLITSCTSKFWGTIGDLFRNGGHFTIDEGTNDPEIVLNKELKFYSDSFEVYLTDSKVKLGFYYEYINPSELVCSTSDASIATCYIEGNYVVVNPKKVGKVDIILQGEVNGKIYKAISKLEVKDASQAITLFQDSGQIFINFSNQHVFTYRLDGITGKITVTSSDESIAKAYVENGVIKIVPVKPGTVHITITIEKNGTTIVKDYEVIIKDDANPNTSTSNGNSGSSNSSSGNGNSGTNISNDRKKDRNNFLSSLKVSAGNLNFQAGILEYYVGVSNNVSDITLSPVLSSSKAKMSFSYNGQSVSSLEHLKLKTGDNTVIIKVTAEDGSTREYKVVINKAANGDNTISSIEHDGEIIPAFSKDTLKYDIYVDSNASKFNFKEVLSNSSSSVQYIWNDKEVSSLNDLSLDREVNTLQIKVTSEDKNTRTYIFHILKKKSTQNTLKDLIVPGYQLEESFDSSLLEYHLNVPYEASNIAMDAILTDSRSKISAKLSNSDGEKETSLQNIALKEGDNTLFITVTSESGEAKVYQVHIHRAVRTLALETTNSTINFEDIPAPFIYYIFDDGKETNSFNVQDVKVKFSNFKGTYEVKENIIWINPDVSMAGVTTDVEVSYQGKVAKGKINFVRNSYQLKAESSSYDLKVHEGQNTQDIVLHTNMFNKGTKVTKIPGGIRVSSKTDDRVYVDIKTDSSLISLSSKEEVDQVSSIAFTVTSNGKSGVATISVSGSAFGSSVASFPIQVNIIKVYNVEIYANGGFFQKNQNEEVLKFQISNLETIDLKEFAAYKEASGNCMYYVLDSYNTKADGSGTKYGLDAIIKNLDHDLTLYAIYNGKDAEYIEVTIPAHYYLYDKDDRGIELFHNEEYFKKYGQDKVIYPGARGSYLQTIENKDNQRIVITGMNLEEDTICIPNKGCLNMGYIIKYSPVQSNDTLYFYGSSTKYQVLNLDSATTIQGSHTNRNISFEPNTIPIPQDKGIEISLLWEWVEENDALDTLIGMESANINGEFTLTVRIDFTKIHDHCKLNN